jgi:hypothetical protein
MPRPKRLLAALAAVACVAVLAPTASARLVPPSAEPLGFSYEAWDVIWGTAQARRSNASPNSLLATRGDRCGFRWPTFQGRAWLLPVSVNGVITVRCTIPAGVHLVFPVAGVADWGLPADRLRTSVRSFFRVITRASLSVDGRSLRPGYIVTTPIYPVDLPPRNGLGEPAGSISLMSKDYFAVLSPLSRGTHVVETSADFEIPGEDPFTLGMTYVLTVR